MKQRKSTRAAYQLLHDGSEALAEVEANGMRVDTHHIKETLRRVSKKIQRKGIQLEGDPIWATWRRMYGARAKMGSREQLGSVLVSTGVRCEEKTVTGRPRMDGGVLEGLGLPFVDLYLEVEKLKKLRSTYLKGLRREVCDGLVHPSFNLHLVRTYRSSSDSPNFQNLPIRDPKMGKMIRSCFRAREGRRLVEIDFNGIEVRIAACYHKDSKMIEYIQNPSKDMHRDMAAECYLLEQGQVSKEIRYCGKNKFVFPQFYGSWWPDCARSLWDAVKGMDLKLVDGTLLSDHLSARGMNRMGRCDKVSTPVRGTFEHHIMEVQKRFWGERFREYDQWKKKWWERYLTRGGFRTLTGFWIEGVLGRNDVINYPVQGSAFHCLLWSLIRVQNKIRRHKMKTLIVGQIHDSIVADVPEDEVEDFLGIAKRVMTEDLVREWDWIIVPIEIEVEAGPVGGTWYDKKEV